MRINKIEMGVGVFILLGVISLIVLALKVSKLTFDYNENTYKVFASFDNVGSLYNRARVSIAGVTVGRVVDIALDSKTYMAKITMQIKKKIGDIPIDSTASIMTNGVLGEKYVDISIGGEERYLKNGDSFSDTQSALILENLIGKFLFKSNKNTSANSITKSN